MLWSCTLSLLFSEHHQWKSGLHSRDPASYVKHITSAQCTLSGKPDNSCASTETTLDDIQMLLDHLSLPEEIETDPILPASHANPKPKSSLPTFGVGKMALNLPDDSKSNLAAPISFNKEVSESQRRQQILPNQLLRNPPTPLTRPHTSHAPDNNMMRPVASTSRQENIPETRDNTAPRFAFVSAREELVGFACSPFIKISYQYG